MSMLPSLRKVAEFDADKVFTCGKGVRGTAPANQTTNIDATFAETRIMTGLKLMVDGAQDGDTANLEIHHPTAGLLFRFYEDFQIAWTEESQGCFESSYPSEIPAGLILRVAYTATNVGADRTVKVNYLLHQRKPEE